MKDIFVGNLNFSTSEGALRQLFAAFGPVTQVRIMMDRDTGKPRGFGFVEMASVEDGDKAVAALNGTLLDERALNVNEARPRKQPEGFRDQHAGARGGGRRW
jgi:cold-inducible RNA-binding protein